MYIYSTIYVFSGRSIYSEKLYTLKTIKIYISGQYVTVLQLVFFFSDFKKPTFHGINGKGKVSDKV